MLVDSFDRFIPRELPLNWDEMVISNFSEAKVHEIWVTNDQAKELKCAALIKQSFGPSFRAHVTGKISGICEAISPHKIVDTAYRVETMKFSHNRNS